ncbi:MAG: hypothetical protein IJA69_04210 [Clostridia bacterium]|nr:hypothetical protein [Clostridia bacterium]
MGKFVQKQNFGVEKYEAIIKNSFKKVLALGQVLKFYKFQFAGSLTSSETFYDTAGHILEKAGIILSRIQERDRVFFKVEQSAYLKKTFKHTTSKIFTHKVGAKDSIKDHAFYLVDGIRGLYSTSFSVDLENVIKNAVPTITISTKADVYKVISGTGFRCYMAHEEIVYKNFETKKKYQSQGMTIKHLGPEQYLDEFNEFNKAVQKHCKEFLVVHDNTFEHAKNVTKKIEVPKLTKEEKKKQNELEKKKNAIK